jgi:hypothetical protein
MSTEDRAFGRDLPEHGSEEPRERALSLVGVVAEGAQMEWVVAHAAGEELGGGCQLVAAQLPDIERVH